MRKGMSRGRVAGAEPPPQRASPNVSPDLSTDPATRCPRWVPDGHAEAMRHANPDELRRLLMRRDDLFAAGMTARATADAVRAGELHRVRRGWYVPAAQWQELWTESRHRAHAIAVADDAHDGGPIFCLVTAAVLHDLPLYRVAPRRVHVLLSDAGRRSVPDVFRHRGSLSDEDIVEIDGMRCTSLERTVFDLARLTGSEVALVCADAAFGVIGGGPRRYDADAAETWRERLQARAAVPRMRGIRHARRIIELADGRAEQPLESVTRLQLLRLGFRRLSLQVPVRAPYEGMYQVDIGIDEADALYECDGEVKYTDPALRQGRTAEEVVLDEKHREDWIRGVTNRRMLRGGSADAVSPEALARRLRRFGVALPSRRDDPLLPRRPLAYGI